MVEPRRPIRPRTGAPLSTQRQRVRGYLEARVDPVTSIFLVVPLFLLYHLGVLLQVDCNNGRCSWVGNGVDFLTANVMSLTHGSRLAYFIITLSVAVALTIAALVARRHAKLHPRMLVPALIESAIYASLVGPIISLIRRITLGAPGSSSYFGDLIASCGAGLHEELIFRAGLFAGGTYLLQRWEKFSQRNDPRLRNEPPSLKPVLIAGIVSSVLFSAVHHMGSLGEPFTFGAFFFRLLAGGIFATIYQYRGFAIAAWTHCIYDIWVFTLQRL